MPAETAAGRDAGVRRCAKVRSSGSIELAIHYAELSSSVFRYCAFSGGRKSGDCAITPVCQNGAGEYEQQRDFPAVEGTSRLSASLATGGLSPRQCLHRLLAEQPQALDGGAGSVWLNELIWREFYRHLITYHPRCVNIVHLLPRRIVYGGSNPAHLQAGRKAKRDTRLLMPPCVSLTALAGCITGYG